MSKIVERTIPTGFLFNVVKDLVVDNIKLHISGMGTFDKSYLVELLAERRRQGLVGTNIYFQGTTEDISALRWQVKTLDGISILGSVSWSADILRASFYPHEGGRLDATALREIAMFCDLQTHVHSETGAA